MSKILTAAKNAVSRFVHEEKGAEGIEKLLIIAAVALPMLGILIVFRGAITDFITARWEEVVGDESTAPTPNIPDF